MGFKFRKSKKILPGVKVNFSKRGVGVSFGGKHARYSISPTGRRTTSFKIAPGLTYSTSSGGKKRKKQRKSSYAVSSYEYPRKELKTSNSFAVIILFVLFILLWIFGIELSWNVVLLKVISILIAFIFIAFMLVNNIPPLKSLVLGLFHKDKKTDIENCKSEVENVTQLIDNESFDIINQAAELCIDDGQASVSYLQRKLKLGYAKTARIMDELERLGVVSPSNSTGMRSVLLTREMWEQRKTMYR